MKKDYSGLIWGIGFIVLGIIFSGNVIGVWDINVFFPGWWTLFLIVPGVISIIRCGFKWSSGILVFIGLLLLLDSFDIIDSNMMWSLTFPLVLLIIGVSIVTSFFRNSKNGNSEKNWQDSGEDIRYDYSQFAEYRAILGGGEHKNNSQDLKGIKAEAIFGGLEIDLSDAKITNDIILDVSALFGGIDIFVPPDAQVEIITGTPILGGFSYRRNRNVEGAPKVRVKYVAIFGGVDIK